MQTSSSSIATPLAGGAFRPNSTSDLAGDYLLARGLITVEQLDEARVLQPTWRMSIGDIVLAKGYVRALDYYRALADYFGLPFVDLMAEPPDEPLLDQARLTTYSQTLTLPWRRKDGTLWIATAAPGPEAVLHLRGLYGEPVHLVVVSKFDVLWTLQRVFDSYYTEQALNALAVADPAVSARTVFTIPQLATAYVVCCLILIGLVVSPIPTLLIFNSIMAVFFLGNFVLKTALAWIGSQHDAATEKVTDAEVNALADADLPVYTVLVPMFREPETLPILSNALRRMDYPFGKLDIKLVLEAGDTATIDAAKRLGLESVFEIIRVPPSFPQTKPKACNYALHFARGEYVVIYDAEDKPEPDQLKRAIVAFRNATPDTVCIQSRLNYFNADENWLTKMFTLDYSLWFDLMLPGLETLGIPIPLGGTSNHFRVDVLRGLHAWDPYNVTEDADLGVRITQRGFRVGTVNSTTFEEANVSIPNWIRQRSRWMKGYMQTYLVHMRNPLALYRTLGHRGFWGFQFFIGGTIVAGLGNPIFWIAYLVWLATRTSMLDGIFPGPLLYISLFNLLLGNMTFTYMLMLGPLRRRMFWLIPIGLTTFFYWVMLSVAAYKGLWQLLRKPFFWEKTNHGLTKVSAVEAVAAAGGSQ